jgi:N-acetylglucosamine-6-phosphate deacetylase
MTILRGSIPSASLSDGIVEITGTIIERVTATTSWVRDTGRSAPPPAGVILPGLIDLHCHGGGGHTFCTTDQEEALAAARHHHAAGTTGVVASIVTAPVEDMLAQVRALAPLAADGHLLGVHLEGPFLAAAHRGAQNPADLMAPDPKLAERLIEAGGGAVKVLTIAPELPKAGEVILLAREAGVTVALGHTGASFDVMRAAIDELNGQALITHVANGMPPMHHRSPGPVAAALTAAAAGEATVELIADGVHVDQGFTTLVFAVAKNGHVALVTDAMAAAGMPDGSYDLGPQRVRVEEGVARLANDTGSLAGGTSHLIDDVTRAAASTPLAKAIAAATTTPARILGLQNMIARGATADLLVTDDHFRPIKVLRAGRFL